MDGPLDLPPPAPSSHDDPTAPFPAPLIGEPTVSVVLHEQPKKRRTGLLVGVAVLLVAVVGAGGFFLLRGDDDEKETFSLAAAGAPPADAQHVAFSMTMSVMWQDIVVDAEADVPSGLTRMTMDFGDALGTEGVIDIISDSNARVVYFSSDLFSTLGLEVDTEWIKLDEAFMQENGGTDASIFETANIGNPLDAGELFANAKSVTDLGYDEVDGVRVKHFEVVVDAAAALDVSPQLQQQFDELSGELPDVLTYDVYVDEQNQIRRTTNELEAGGSKLTTDIVIKQVTEPIVIEVPAAEDVTAINDPI